MTGYCVVAIGLGLAAFIIFAYVNERRGFRRGLTLAKRLASQEARRCRIIQAQARNIGEFDAAATAGARATAMRCFANHIDSEMASRFMSDESGTE